MQKIDQEKLSEFNEELSAFQTEASKTASMDVYDRFTISKLEDHVVDLCQLSIDASHSGLQYLCERLGDNIRDHFITGTNISDNEFALMSEWKTLVKAYLVDNENEGVISALAANLSKSGWTYPLNPDDTGDVVSVLLGKNLDSQTNSSSNNGAMSADDAEEFDAYMQASDESLADVFESFKEDEDDSIVNYQEEKESSIAAFFEQDEDINLSSKIDGEQSDSLDLNITEEQLDDSSKNELPEIDQEISQALPNDLFGSEKNPQQPDYDDIDKDILAADAEFKANSDASSDKVEVSDQELEEINQSVADSIVDELYVADDSEYNEEYAEDLPSTEAVLANNNDTLSDKVEVSDQELQEIDQSVSDSIVDELHVADDSADDSEYNKEYAEDLPSAEAVLANSDDTLSDKVEVSDQELQEIDQSVSDSIVDELYVADDSVNDSEYDEDMLSTKAVFANNDDTLSDKVEVSDQELQEIDQSVSDSIVDELYVADDSINDSEYDEDMSSTKAVLANNDDSSSDKGELSDQELEEIDLSVADSMVEALFVADSTGDDEDKGAEYSEEVASEISVVDVVLNDSGGDLEQEPVLESLQHAEGFVANTVANELFVEDNNSDESNYNEEFNKDLSEVESISDSSFDTTSTITEEILVTDESDVSLSQAEIENQNSQENTAEFNEPETVYIEPVEKKPEAPKSIIEAYVGVMADKIRGNRPRVLEQALIEQPPKPSPVKKLEPVESILLKYPDWDEEQKELLSLILSEVHDVIDQQDEAMAVLHQDKKVEQDILDMVSLYSEQVERMSSAAEMVGLDALQKLCELIGFHFGDLEKSSTEMIVSSEERIRKWPYIVYDYLKNIQNEKSHQEAINYISDAAWARTIREDIKTDLKEAFSRSTIHVEKTKEDQRITQASAQDVDIAVPEDVRAELLDGLLQELPHQAEEFSEAIQQLIKDEYLTQLEVTQRIAHTIKGAANTVGIVGVATLTHHLEDILQALLKAKAKPSTDLHMALIEASDCLEQMTECLLGQGDQPDDAMQTMQVILDWANYIDEFGVPKDDAKQEVVLKATQQSATVDQADSKEKDTKAKSSQDASLRVPANMIDELINQSGESIIATSQMHENVNKLLISMRDIKKNKDSVYSLSQQLEHMIDVQGASDKFSKGKKDEKFDPLELDEYNELHTYSRRLIEATADSVELIKDLEERLFSLESVIADQTRAQKDNQYAILKTRMMPVESVVARLKRGVRQAAKISGKSVELEVLGVETLLDSKILTNLIDPLMHLLRNSVDHGIESKELREENGKSSSGKIKLSFSQVGERLEITCEDDGKGLDPQAIKARAIDKGMILNDQALSDEEIHQIIMQHGFTTRDEVTQLSGRGVGMDVVYSNIKDLNGSIIINSELNKGMNVELSLPLSLLTAHALLIPTISGSMAVSASGIEEILQVDLDNLKETEQGLTLQFEDNVYPAVHLEQLLKMRLSVPSHKRQGFTALLVDEFGGQKKVVLVSEIQSVRDIIIKPISHYLPKVVGIVGATVLGNGDIAPVVDVADLLSQHTNVIGKLNIENSVELEEIHQASVLVVEDSISTRRSLAEFMQDLNYKVYTAKDGVEAIEIMRDHSPTLLLTDLEMPRMNGLELTSYVRSHDETKDIPIIMLTSRTTEKHRQEAKSIGVDEYLSKPFVEDILLEKVQSLAILK